MEGIVRVVNDYVNKQIRHENSTLNRFAAKSEVLEQLEIIFNEPSDTGLNFNLQEMFNAWQELSKNPESLNFKTIVVEKSKTLSETLNHMMRQLNDLEVEANELIGKNVDEFNSIVTQLETLNQQIYNISVKGQIPNDLMDQRDLLLKRLSSIADIEADFVEYNRVEVSLGGKTILDVNTRYELNIDNGDLSLFNSGQIKGYHEAIEDIIERRDDLKSFAENLAKTINEVHNTEVGDKDFFVFDVNGKLEVNKDIRDDNNLVKTGKKDAPEGDGSVALEIAGLRNKRLDNGTTIAGTYRDMVTKIGISKEHADSMVSNQEALVNQLVLRRESSSGVSIDEEVTNLIKFQKAYEANARVIQVLSEMLDTLINRTGV